MGAYHTVEVKTRQRVAMVDITERVADIVSQSGVREGICVIFVPHTTAALTINENADPAVQHDMITDIGRIVPQRREHRHTEGNSDAHLKTTLYGPSLTIIISGGILQLGTWQGIYFCEFDGPRRRRIMVKVIEA